MQSLKVVCHKKVTWLLHVLSVEEITLKRGAMTPQVFSSVVKRVTSRNNIQRRVKVVGIGAIGFFSCSPDMAAPRGAIARTRSKPSL